MIATTITRSELLEQKRREKMTDNISIVIGGLLIGLVIGIGFIIV